MKRIFVLILALVFALSMTACGSQQETAAPEQSAETAVETAPGGVEETGTGKEPSGVNEDGIGEDPSFGEGIGEVVALTPDEKSFMLAQTTNSWLELTRQEKDDLVVLIGRWMEEVTGFIVEDYDDMVVVLDHQMEQYYRNGVNESVVRTAGDIYRVALPLDDLSLPGCETPSGVNEDGIGAVVALTPDEESFMLAQTTNSWLELTRQEKDHLVVLIGRTLEASHGFIVEDYDELVAMLDHQMEQYYRNGVDENVLATVRDIYRIG